MAIARFRGPSSAASTTPAGRQGGAGSLGGGYAAPAALVAPALVFALTFAFRLWASRPQLYDATFLPLEMASSILLGDLPGRDFLDPGFPLYIFIATLGQALLGYRVLSEFLICAGFIALAMSLVFALAREAARSTRIAALVTALAVGTMPDFYHYPKVFVFPFAAWLCWRYLDRPTAARAVGLGAGVAVAFLFRHDYGLYIGLAAALTLALAHLRRDHGTLLRRGAVSAATGLLAIAPFLVLVHLTEGLAEYFDQRRQLAGEVGWYRGIRRPSLAIDWSAAPAQVHWIGLVADLRPQRMLTTIRIRWRADVTPERRAELERRYGLVPVAVEEGDRRRYTLTDTSPGALAALARERRIEDFDNFEPRDARIRDQTPAPYPDPWWPLLILDFQVPIASIAPGIFHRTNALVWLYYTALAVPVLTVWLLIVDARRRRVGRLPGTGATKLVVAATIAGLANYGHLREIGYVPAVLPVGAVLAAWLVARMPPPRRAETRAARPGGAAQRAATIALVVITAAFTLTCFDPAHIIRETGLSGGLQRASGRLADLVAVLAASPPIDGLALPGAAASTLGSERTFLRYLHECTRPDDRILRIGGTASHIVYYAERRIAAGRGLVVQGWRTDREDQRRTIEHLEGQSVPFVIFGSYFESTDRGPLGMLALRRFGREYGLVSAYLARHYVQLLGTDGPVLVDNRRTPTGTYDAMGLPCFR